MAPETATSPKTAEAAAAGAPASSVWRSCRLICLIFAARLYCCAPPSLAEDTWPWALSEATTDEQAALERVEDVPHSGWDGFPRERKEALVSEWEFVEALYPRARQTRLEPLPAPTLKHGELELERLEKWETELTSLGHLDQVSGRLYPSPLKNSDRANLKAMDMIVEIFLEEYRKADLPDENIKRVFIPGAPCFYIDRETAQAIREKYQDPIGVPKPAPFAAEARRLLSEGPELSSIARAAVLGGFGASIKEDNHGNIKLKLWFPDPKRTEALSWEYSTSFNNTTRGLIQTEDSLILTQKGDAEKNGLAGNWIYDEKVTRTFYDSSWKLPKARVDSNLKCFQKGSQEQLKYEHTWETELNGPEIVNETFKGKVHMTPGETSIDKAKAHWIKISEKDDHRRVVEKGLEMIDDWKLHNYFIAKRSKNPKCCKIWHGAAWSDPSNVLVGLDKMPIDTHQNFGICEEFHPLYGNPTNEMLTDYTRYGCIKTKPSAFYATTHSQDLLRSSRKLEGNAFSYTSEDLKFVVSPEAVFDPERFHKLQKIKVLKDIFTSPLDNEEITQQNQGEVSQLLGDPCNNPDCRAIRTSHKLMALNGTLVLLTALTLLAFAKLLKSPSKVRKEFRGTGSTTYHL